MTVLRKHTIRATRLVFAWLLLVLIGLNIFATPQGERWFDVDGSVCGAAEIGHCILPGHNKAVSPPAPTIRPDHGDFVGDEGCTDCRHVSFNALRGKRDASSVLSLSDNAVGLATIRMCPPATLSIRPVGSRANAPPPIYFSPCLESIISPRAPPAS